MYRNLLIYRYIHKKPESMSDKDSTLRVVCTGCGAKMLNYEFNQHDCPNTPQPIEGESWEDYSNRVDEYRTKNK